MIWNLSACMTLLYDLIVIIDTWIVPAKSKLQIFRRFSTQENVVAAKVHGRDSEQHTFLLHGLVNRTLKVYLQTARISNQNAQYLLSYFMDLHSAVIIIIIIIIVFIFVKHIISCVSGSSVGIATELRAGRSGIESRWGRHFPPVQTMPWGPPSLL
jgi:hypothetical protein